MNDDALIFAGIIVGLAVADQLVSLHRLLMRRNDVRWDPLLLWLSAIVMVTQVQVWWTVAGGQSVAMTIADFLPAMFGLVILFLLAAASLPDGADADDGGVDLRLYYARHQRYVWTLFTLATLTLVLSRFFARPYTRIGFFSVENLVDVGLLGLMATLIFVRKRWWHAVVLALLTVGGPGLWLSKTLS